MKKGIAIFFALLLIGLLVYFLLENQNGKSKSDTFILPEMKVASIQIKSFDEESVKLEFGALIDNKMPISIQLDSIRYRIELEDILVTESTYRDSIYLEASDSSRITLPITSYLEEYAQVIEKANEQNEDSVSMQVHTTFYTDLAIAPGPHELSFSRRIPIVRQPKVNIENVSIEKFGLDQSEVEIKIRVINPNQVGFSIKNTSYQFEVSDEDLVSGDLNKLTALKADDTATFIIPVKVNVDQVGESLFNLLFNPGTTSYSFRMSSTLESKLDMINNSRFYIRNEGKLQELIN